MKATEVKSMPVEELNAIQAVKKDIARVKTAIRSAELSAQQ